MKSVHHTLSIVSHLSMSRAPPELRFLTYFAESGLRCGAQDPRTLQLPGLSGCGAPVRQMRGVLA